MHPGVCIFDQDDALSWLRSKPTDWLDLMFGSPPYSDKGARYPGGKATNLVGKEWAAWMAEIMIEATRVCSGLVAFVADAGVRNHAFDPAVFHLVAMLDDAGICLARPGIYYRNGTPGNRCDLRGDYELIIRAKRPGPLPYVDLGACASPPKYGPGGSFSNRDAKGVRKKRKSYRAPFYANPGNVAKQLYSADEVAQRLLDEHAVSGDVPYFPNGGGHLGSDQAHKSAAPFSQWLADFYVRTFSGPGKRVGDPFFGSGTVAAAALASGRAFAGCDNDEKMLPIARQRVEGFFPTPASS